MTECEKLMVLYWDKAKKGLLASRIGHPEIDHLTRSTINHSRYATEADYIAYQEGEAERRRLRAEAYALKQGLPA